jgi:hypothetical protein
MKLERIISGAQTGADQGSLKAAILLGLEPGGFIPKDGKTEAGHLSSAQIALWQLAKAPSYDYPTRTRMNIVASDGTLLIGNTMSPGSSMTIKLCHELSKPIIINPDAQSLADWLTAREIQILNVAGNRASQNPGIEARTIKLLSDTVELLRNSNNSSK